MSLPLTRELLIVPIKHRTCEVEENSISFGKEEERIAGISGLKYSRGENAESYDPSGANV